MIILKYRYDCLIAYLFLLIPGKHLGRRALLGLSGALRLQGRLRSLLVNFAHGFHQFHCVSAKNCTVFLLFNKRNPLNVDFVFGNIKSLYQLNRAPIDDLKRIIDANGIIDVFTDSTSR
jgi:hypothetical protein